MNRDKRPDNRSRILSPEGWQRLRDAIAEKFGEACRDKPPFQQLSNLSELPGERPLDPDTVSKIWRRKKGVYRSKLERLFTALELELNQSDHISFSEDLNTKILAPDTKASTKPQRESVESNAGSIEERYFRATSKFDSLEPLERKSRIQVLEEIASNKDFPRYHWKVMEFLADFVRKKAPRREEEEGEEERSPEISEDIQAALTVIGQRDPEKDPQNKKLDLSNTDIRGANLREGKLQGVNLRKANLQGVNFDLANLQGAILKEVNLQGASFYNANLQEEADLRKANLQEVCFLGAKLQGAFLSASNMQGVNLRGAKLKGASLTIANLEGASLDGADLSRANLQGANFMGANLLEVDLAESNLQGTKFRGADLTNAKNIELQQIESAYVDSTTTLPDYLERLRH